MERWKGSWLWAVAAAAGLALVMGAFVASSAGSAVYATADDTATAQANGTATAAAATQTAGPTATQAAIETATAGPGATATSVSATATAQATTPTATATSTGCDLQVTKDSNESDVPEGGEITYTIRVRNEATSGSCTNLDVTDNVPNDVDCTSASVTDDGGLSFNDTDITNSCNDDNTVRWTTSDNLDNGGEVTLEMIVTLNSNAQDGDTITNEACADSDNGSSNCDSVDVDVTGATATPTSGPTATPFPTVVVPTARPVVPPAAVVAPSLTGPLTGTGPSSGGGSSPLPLALGLLGGVLLLASGTLLVKRTR